MFGEEQAWEAGGGGFSGYAPMPSWQADAVGAYLAGDATGGIASLFNASNRGYPDVSALGGGYNPYCMSIDSKGWYGIYGTSASSPIFAGMVARLKVADEPWAHALTLTLSPCSHTRFLYLAQVRAR